MTPAMSQRCGTVVIVGAPNVGKSTFMNTAVGQKLAIVSNKVQTTRTRLLGIVTQGDAQILFLDTPGIFATPRNPLEKRMLHEAFDALAAADVVVLMVAVPQAYPDHPSFQPLQRILEGRRAAAKPTFLVINKVDKQKDKGDLLPLAAAWQAQGIQDIFLISATRNKGVGDVVAALAKRLPERPWQYDGEELTNVPMRLLAAEITREKLFHRLHQEVPYALTVLTETWEARGGSVRIGQCIHVLRETHKRMVIGQQGHMLKTVGAAARADMAVLLGQPVHLFLHVRVTPDWPTNPTWSDNAVAG